MPTERDIVHPEAHPRERASAFGHAEIRTGPGGGFLIGAGMTLLIAGTVLALGPKLMPDQALFSTLADLGLSSFPLFAAGGLFCGLWFAVRTSRAHSIAAQQAVLSSGPVIAELGDRVVDLKDGLQGIRLELVYLKESLQAHIDRQTQASRDNTHAEATYRLAASLDQLGARIEKQILASQSETREKIEALQSAVEVVRHERHDGRIHLGEPHDHEHHDEPGTEHEEGEVHDTAHPVTALVPIDPSTPDLDHEAGLRGRLGILDLLDDLGRLLPRKAPTTVQERPVITAEAFEGMQEEGWDRHEAVASALPSIRLDAGTDAPRAGSLLAGPDAPTASDDLAIVKKLEELRALLADTRVRDALTSMDHVDG